MKKVLQKMKEGLSNREVLLTLIMVTSIILVGLLIFGMHQYLGHQKPAVSSDTQTVATSSDNQTVETTESVLPPEKTTPSEEAIPATTPPEEATPAGPNIKVGNTSYLDYQTVNVQLNGTAYEVRAGAEVQTDNTTLYKVWFPNSSSGGIQFIFDSDNTTYGIQIVFTQGAYRALLIEEKTSVDSWYNKLCQELNQKLAPVELKTSYVDYQEKTITIDGETNKISYGCETWTDGTKLYKVKFLESEKQYFISTIISTDSEGNSKENIVKVFGIKDGQAFLMNPADYKDHPERLQKQLQTWYQLLDQLK